MKQTCASLFICITMGVCKTNAWQDLLASIYYSSVITVLTSTKSTTRLLVSIHHLLLITREHYLTCTTVYVNIYMCNLILVCSLCTREHHESYLWNVSRHTEVHEFFCKLRCELYCSILLILILPCKAQYVCQTSYV